MIFSTILASLLFAATPVSREYVDNQIRDTHVKIGLAETNAVDRAQNYTDEQIRTVDEKIDTAKQQAIQTAEEYTDDKLTEVDIKIGTAKQQAIQTAEDYTDEKLGDVDEKIGTAKQQAIKTSNDYTDEKIKSLSFTNKVDVVYGSLANPTFLVNATGELYKVENEKQAEKPYDKFATTNELEKAIKNIDTSKIYKEIQIAKSNAVYEANEYTDSKVWQQTYLYDDSDILPTNLLNSIGQMYRLYTPNPKGGTWSVGQVVGEQVITFEAPFKGHDEVDYHWQLENIFDLVYCLTNGLLNITYTYDETKTSIYYCGINNNPLKNQLKDFEYVSGHKFDSLRYVPQGETLRDPQPYDSFIGKKKYDADRLNTVTTVNGKSGNVTITIPDVSNYASKDYVNQKVNNTVFQDDAFSRDFTEDSIVGRINILEQTTKKQQQNIVNYIWSEKLENGQVLDAYGQVFNTVFEPYGHWQRTTLTDQSTILELYDIGSESEGIFIWKSSANNTMQYNPVNGEVKQNGIVLATIQTNLNPTYSHELGSVTNLTDRNLLTFVKRGYVREKTRKDVTVFNSELPSKTVTGLNYDNIRYSDGSIYYFTDKIILPDYKADYNSKFRTLDMYGDWSSGYTENSIVGRIHTLEIGGISIKTNLNRIAMTEYLDEQAKTNDSIVGTLYRIRENYTTREQARTISTNEIDKIDNKFIKERGFYNTNDVDRLISEKIEQKRGLYLFNDIDNPTQVVDSKGQLFKYGIEDFGGMFNVTYSVGGQYTYGLYRYAGKIDDKNTWTNTYAKQIWYDPATGAMGDPNATYEGSEAKAGLDPEKCDVIPSIDTESTKATFYKQESSVPTRYKQPYDRFATKTELDEQVDETAVKLTNNVPVMYIGADKVERRFNPYFTVSKNFDPGTAKGTYVRLTQEDTVKIPIKTLLYNKIDLQFTAKIPDPATYRSVQFINPSDKTLLPEIGIYHGYSYSTYYQIEMKYPDSVDKTINNNLFNTEVSIRLIIEKGSGPMSLVISNLSNNATFSYQGYVNVKRSEDDYFTLGIGADSVTSGDYLLNIDSLVVKFDDIIEQKLVGEYASEYVKVKKLYADAQLGNQQQINLKLATTEDYGFVKPDGKTIKIDSEGKLTSVGGSGGSVDDIVNFVSKTNITYFTGAAADSIVGKTLSNEQNIGEISTKVDDLTDTTEEILQQLKSYNSRLQKALDGK